VLYSLCPGGIPEDEWHELNRHVRAIGLAVGLLLASGAAQAEPLSQRRAERALDRARRLAEKGETGGAVEVLDTLLETNPDYIEAHLLFIELRAKSAQPVVQKEYERRLTKEPTSALLHFLVGYTAADPKAKLQHYRKGIELDPNLFHAHLELGRLCRLPAVGDLPASQRALETATALRPMSSEAHLELGRTFDALGQLRDAIAEYRRAVELDSGCEAGWLGLLRALRRQPQPAKGDPVEEALGQALAGCPRSGALWWQRADVRWARRQFREAVFPLECALDYGPKANYAVEAKNRLACGYLLQGWYRSARRLGPTAWDAAVAEMAEGRLSAEAFRALVEPPDRRPLALLKTVRVAPKSAVIHEALGQALFDGENYAAAAKAFVEAMLLRPGDSELRWRTALAYLLAGNPSAALTPLQLDRARLSRDAAWLIADAEALAARQVSLEAITARHAARALRGQNPAERLRLLRACVEKFPSYLTARLELAHALRDAGTDGEARTLLKESDTIKGHLLVEADRQVQLGDFALADKAPAEAILHYKAAVERCPGVAGYHGALARACVEQGDFGSATDALTRQLVLDPRSYDLPDSGPAGQDPGCSLLPQLEAGDVLRYRYSTDGGQPRRKMAAVEFDYVIEAVRPGHLVEATLEVVAVTGRIVEGGKGFVGVKIPVVCSGCFGLVSVTRPEGFVPREFAHLLWLIQFIHGPALPAPRWPGQAWRETAWTELGRPHGGTVRFERVARRKAHLAKAVSYQKPPAEVAASYEAMDVAGEAAIVFDLQRHVLERVALTTRHTLTTESRGRVELPSWQHRLELLRVERGARKIGKP